MNKKQILIFIILMIFVDTTADAITCGQFNALGIPANTEKEVLNTKATDRQVTEFKQIIASHAANISFFGFSSKAKALKLVRKSNMLSKIMRETLAITRHDCFFSPTNSLEKVAVDNFDYFLDAVAKKNNL